MLSEIFNPLFIFPQQPQLTNHSASNKRHRFKRSMRLRLSESSMNLSLEGVGSYSPPPSVEHPGGSERLQKSGDNPQRRVHAGAGVLRRTPAVSPGSAEEDDMISAYVPQVITVVYIYFFHSLSDSLIHVYVISLNTCYTMSFYLHFFELLKSISNCLVLVSHKKIEELFKSTVLQ